MIDAGTFEMRCSRRQTLAAITNAMFFGVIGVVFAGLGLWAPFILDPWMGVLGTLAFGGVGLVVVAISLNVVFRMTWQLRHRGPVVEIGPAGLHDHRLSVEPIPWSDIDSVSSRLMTGTWVLVLSMSPEAVQRYIHSRVDSRILRWRYRRSGGVNVSPHGLDRPFEDLVAAVDRHHRQRAS